MTKKPVGRALAFVRHTIRSFKDRRKAAVSVNDNLAIERCDTLIKVWREREKELLAK